MNSSWCYFTLHITYTPLFWYLLSFTVSPSSPSPSIIKTHIIMPTEKKKKKNTPPLPFMPARLLVSGSARQLSRVQLHWRLRFITVNMIHLPSRDLNQTQWFGRAIGRITCAVESSSLSSSSTSPSAAPLTEEVKPWEITLAAAMRRITGKAKDETLIELQSATDSQTGGNSNKDQLIDL